jgi:hypothetical protein
LVLLIMRTKLLHLLEPAKPMALLFDVLRTKIRVSSYGNKK